MRVSILILFITACGTETVTTTTTTPITPTTSTTSTAETDTIPPTPTTPTTQTTSTTKPPLKDYRIKFTYYTGQQFIGVINCELIESQYSNWFIAYVDQTTFDRQTSQPGCVIAEPKLVSCAVTDNYVEKTAECGSIDPVTGGRSGRKTYKEYNTPDFSAWN